MKTATRAADLHPGDTDILTDIMVINFRAKMYKTADSLATLLIETDSSLAHPYLIRGFIEEARGNVEEAIEYFEKFCSLAPEEPETPHIRKRANDLFLKMQGQ